MKYNKLVIVVVMIFGIVSLVQSQTVDFSTNIASGSCNNTSVNFTGSATSTTTATSFTFNGGALPSGWSASPFTVSSSTCPGKNSPDNSPYFWATNTASSGSYS